jgi:hypothetical protein
MAYVSLIKSHGGNEFTLMFGDQKLALPAPSHIRLQLSGTEARLAVLDGGLRVDGPNGPLDVSKKKTVTFDLMDHQPPEVARDILPEAFDSWDHDSVGYHARVANASMFNGSPYSYGLNDMMYYGSFVDGGCGMGMAWRPYFTSAAWDPFSNGAWAYYQGAGYSWVSPYPWGWTPYHSGSWGYCPSSGWGWQPSSSWNGLNNLAVVRYQGAKPGSGVGHLPPAPIHPPRAGEPTMLAVNSKPVVRSEPASSQSFVFRKDSAGLGVPRNAFCNLTKFSEHTESRGAVSEHIYVSAPSSSFQGGRPTNTAVMAGSIHRGSAPSGGSFNSSSSSQSGSSSGRSGGGTFTPAMSSGSSGSHSSASSSSSSSSSGRSH